MTRVVVTNDDGIDAPGLHQLAASLHAAGLDVVVAAPTRERSGSSAGITATEEGGRIVAEERDLPGLPDVCAYAVAATPGFIAMIATRGAFGDPPDLLVSGINRGANCGNAVLHSGTVGAAFTAAIGGIRAMAVSLDVPHGKVDGELHWSTAGRLAVELLPLLDQVPGSVVLNLNVPDAPEIAGVRQAPFGGFGQVQIGLAEITAGAVWTTLEETAELPKVGTDLDLLAQGYATITPVRPLQEAPIKLTLPALPAALAR
ncbi:5'-nucleotidase [Hamadaea flava]|uniref:5'-nucleotidase n=1 Tax=Hamadaea flava TaxID=1742688 RepID=A0ABV8LRI0_9ACTN|nr:5'/3'-nucleotidase SurE [Hamadaea flava]MCP2322526.1 5'-nucleotidase [Hamadaea flava]